MVKANKLSEPSLLFTTNLQIKTMMTPFHGQIIQIVAP